MGRKVDVDDRLRLVDRNLPHTWLRRYPGFPRPVLRLAIGHVWQWSEVERWAAPTGRGRWEDLPHLVKPRRRQ